VPSLADGRDRLLVVGVLATLLGLGLAGAGLVGPAPHPEEAAVGAYSPAWTVPPGAAASSLAGGDRCDNDPACRPGYPPASRPGTAVLAPIAGDPREYFSEMAAMPRRRRESTATMPDPYQASLNPAVYRAGQATPIAHDGTPTSVPRD
jgi:hypothetical protein